MCRSLLQIFLTLNILLVVGCENIGVITAGQDNSVKPAETSAVSKMPDTGTKISSAAPDKSQPQRPTRMRREFKVIRLEVNSIELPAGTAGRLEKFWTFLDEEPVSLHSTVLGMNGFRVGVGRNCDWAEVESLLARQGGLSFQKKIIETRLGYPAHLEMKTGQPVQNIFIFSDAQTLRGEHFPPGDNLLTLSTFLDEETNRDIIIVAVPQIRSTVRHFGIETDNDDPRIVYKSQFYPLDEMAFRVKMPTDDFLVIGPGSQASRPNSVANHFLTCTKQGMDYDRIFVIRPYVIRVPFGNASNGAGDE
ncbi:MAG TPA: hypothetical protein PKK48_03055 [Phycisphaerae bacterium]|nr:hypothetical protein [Phycisphaerae bacterium]HPS52497.1 hypothetical protein [Phycisphaerae bacterium]